jgi:catechol 2,3-dioxygenase-like lactoylglutathione lyase family enzyme
MNQYCSLKRTRKRGVFVIVFLLLAAGLRAQTTGPGIIGKTFFAVNVSNADSTARWYEEAFGLRLLKEIKAADGSAHVRIEGNDFLMVEILQVKDSKSLDECNLQHQQAHLLRGYFKAGVFVSDVRKAEEYFKTKGLVIRHPVFKDKETATSSFILEDPNGNMLQFIQEGNAK